MSAQSSKEHQKDVGQRIRNARELAGLTQGQAARILDLHRPSISEIEAGRRKVSTEELLKFAEAYDASTSYFLGQTGSSVEIDNPKIRMAARELQRLPPEALDGLLKLLATFQNNDEDI